MSYSKPEISIWLFILLVLIVGIIIGFIISLFPDSSSRGGNNQEIDDYNHIDFD